MGPILTGLIKLQSVENLLRAEKAKLTRCRRNVIIQENKIRSLQNALEAKKEEIVAGEFDVFMGPIKDQDGEIRIEEGEIMPDEDKLAFDWLVEGVVGFIPE